MKRLIQYINEALLFEAKITADDIIKKMQNQSKLGDYVDYLNKMLQDDDAKQILVAAFGESTSPNALKFNGSEQTIAVKDLHPTQKEIDVKKSLGYPFKGVKEAETNMKEFFQNSQHVNMPFPLITFNGKYILDGHHRWSQVYTFNPEAKMVCFDITQSQDDNSGKKIDEQQALKICQGTLAAKRAKDGKGKIPVEKVDSANVFTMQEDEIKSTIKGYCEENKDAAKIIRKAEKASNDDALADKLCANLMDLRKDNKAYSDKGNARIVMPQTDKGGDDPENKKTARPEVQKSALNVMANGKFNPDVV